MLFLAACSRGPDVRDAPGEASAPPEPAGKTAELVICIDNSASIRPPEQVIIREATMLLADFADAGDRISVITFGDGARLAVSTTIRSDADRQSFKDAIRQRVDFREQFSDIRACAQVAAENIAGLFPTPKATHALILFSDGKLETRDRRTQEAFAELLANLSGPLRNVNVYPVVLGDTSSKHPIPRMAALTGYELLCRRLARSPEDCYHARQLDQLLAIAVTLLNKTKGVSSLGEEGGTAFRIDQTARAMTLIVRKRPAGAPADLPAAEEIHLQPPDETSAQSPPAGESIYRSSDYQNIDLFLVRNPRLGIWRITRRGGGKLIVLSKLDSPITLRVKAKSHYFLNEAAALQAWLWDDERPGPSLADYQLQAHVAAASGLAASPYYAPLRRDSPTDEYRLNLPAALGETLGTKLKPGPFELEIIAQRPDDPWFLRRSPPLVVALTEPLTEWFLTATVQRPLPTRRITAPLGGRLIPERYAAAGFEAPPELTVTVERLDDETGQYAPYAEAKGRPEGDRLVFQWPVEFNDYGDYRYGYRLTGVTAADGPFTIHSPWYPLRIQFFWEAAAAIGVIILALIQLLSSLTARLKGQIQLEKTAPNPGFASASVSPRREFNSAVIREIPLGAIRFRIRPKRYFFMVKRFCITVSGGAARLDQRPLEPGKTRCVPVSGKHQLSWVAPDGGTITATLTLRV